MKEIFRLCFVLTVIAALSAGVLAFVNQKTADPIANALREEKLQAIRNVLPPFDNQPDEDTLTIAGEEGGVICYLGLEEGRIVGVAFAVTAHDGYSGDIELMVGVDTTGIVQGIEILRHLETPGLGAKITESEFREQYRGTSSARPAEWKVTKDGGTFVPITGATISSRAVTAAVSRGLSFYEANAGAILGRSGRRGEVR